MAGISSYLVKLLGQEQYAFTWEELKVAVPKSDAALQNELARAVKKGEIISLRAGFYLILPPRYRSYGRLPVELYVDRLFKYLEKPYYIAFYSASRFYGASHQQVQQDYVITQFPNIRDIKKGSTHLHLYATSKWPLKNIVQRKSDAGYFNVSSPALTATDLIHFQSKLGGINRMLAILQELSEEIRHNDVKDLLTWYPHVSTIQRLGYLLTAVKADGEAVGQIQEFLAKHRHFPVLLSPESNRKPGSAANPWKIDVNVKLDSDI